MDAHPDNQHHAITLLYRINEALLSGNELKDVLDGVLQHLADYGMERCMISIYDPGSEAIWIDASHGLSEAERERGRYDVGEGIIGEVIARKRPVVVPSIGAEPEFLDRTGARGHLDLDLDHIAFICVPLLTYRQEVIGTLSVDRRAELDGLLEDDLRLLQLVSTMIGDAVRYRREFVAEAESQARISQRLDDGRPTQPKDIVGKSRQMREVFQFVEQVAPFETTVLIRGESGTGKELIARAIHYASKRSAGPFVSVNCGALPEQLVESELFGHVRGAYTGAVSARRGRFEVAHKGTIFLDEIGELPQAMQVKLLRVIQQGEIHRVGAETAQQVDVRIIAATNANLEEAIERGEFREDLYYRLNVFPILVPPLRERRTDITLLADHFVEKYGAGDDRRGPPVVRISTPAIELMMSYHWPGNVRELENCVARAVLLSDDGVIRAHHLPPSLQTGDSSGTTKSGSLESMMGAYEREILIEAMKNAGGNITQAARSLQTTHRILSYRLRKHGLHKPLVKSPRPRSRKDAK